MNRAERRQLTREQKLTKKEVINTDRKQKTHQAISNIEERENNIIKESIGIATENMFIVLGTILADKLGWGKVRISRLFQQIDDRFDSVSNGYVNLNELRQYLSNEIGVELE